jgi:hypothetical protein
MIEWIESIFIGYYHHREEKMAEVMNQDENQLNLLALFHYIVAGMVALFSCMFIIHLVIGIVTIVAPEKMASQNGTMPPPFFGWMFALIGGIAVLTGWTLAVCLIIAGRFLKKRRNYLFCLVAAGISCLFMPFGTVLGVFTILVLQRPSVKTMFT